jgi:hypothetical protein
MDFSMKVSDWQFAGVVTMGGAGGIGAGVFWFEFFSQRAAVREVFYLAAAGLGLGGSLGGASPVTRRGTVDYSPISCIRPFSVNDLDNSSGAIGSGGVALVVGIGYTFISALNREGLMFQRNGGVGINLGGAGAGVFEMMGTWRSSTLAAREASQVTS